MSPILPASPPGPPWRSETSPRTGEPRALGPIGRILCLKLDHIGDLLIAIPALLLLRKSFPNAEITVVCAPWNTALIRRLKVADHLWESAFFSQSSMLDMDYYSRELRRLDSIAELQGLPDTPFDLAIDFRRDEDTRPLLKLFDARIYAGMGDLATYSYLDVAVPVTHRGVHLGADMLHVGPGDFDAKAGHRIDEAGLHLTANMGRAIVTIATDTVWSPAENGAPDHRTLGVALTGVFVRQFKEMDATGTSIESTVAVELQREDISFGPGWLAWEPWGKWSTTEQAHFEIMLPTAASEVELLVSLQGHTGAGHPSARVEVSTGTASAAYVFTAGEEPSILRLPCPMTISHPIAKSAPMLLRAGRYRGNLRIAIPEPSDWESVTLVIRGDRMGNVIARMACPSQVDTAGILDFPFEVELLDTGEPIRIEIGSEGRLADRRLAIVSVDLACMQARSPLLPATHMEQQLLDLAALVSVRYATRIVKPREGEIERLLSSPSPKSSAAPARRILRRLRGKGALRSFRRHARTLIGIGIGANKETKLWPMAHWRSLCARLLERPDVVLVFIGGPAERPAVSALLSELDAGGRAVDLCACCKIEDLGELLVDLDGLIGLDTGTTHFAGRVGLKTLALFGPSHDAREWGPVGTRSGWVTEDIACGSCFLSEARQCAIDVACMDRLTPERIWPFVERYVFD